MNTIAARIKNKELIKKLKLVAEETERPMSYHIEKAIQYYLDDYLDLLIARERMVDPTEQVFTIEEAKQQLDL